MEHPRGVCYYFFVDSKTAKLSTLLRYFQFVSITLYLPTYLKNLKFVYLKAFSY